LGAARLGRSVAPLGLKQGYDCTRGREEGANHLGWWSRPLSAIFERNPYFTCHTLLDSAVRDRQ